MPKLLQINVVNNSGSTGKIAEGIGRVAIKNGWESYIAYGRRTGPSKSKLIKIGNRFDIFFHLIKSRLFDKQGLGSVKSTKKFLKVLDSIQPDIVHIHVLHGYYINYPLLFKYLQAKNIPTFCTLHDCWNFTGHCAFFSFYKCDKWQIKCTNCEYKKSYPKSIFFDNSYNNYMIKKNIFGDDNFDIQVIPVSNWLANLLKKSFLAKKNINVIYNGIDLDIFKPRLCKKRTNKFVILGVADIFGERKGFDDFIKLNDIIGTEHYQIILVGLSRNEKNKLPSSIIGIERTKNVEQLVDLYSNADIYLNLTYDDNYPTTNLEAMACGTPVLTYNTGGSPESITVKTGFVVEQGDLNGVVQAIKEVFTSGKQKYSESCRKYAIENFNMDEKYCEYLNLYKSVLEKRV